MDLPRMPTYIHRHTRRSRRATPPTCICPAAGGLFQKKKEGKEKQINKNKNKKKSPWSWTGLDCAGRAQRTAIVPSFQSTEEVTRGVGKHLWGTEDLDREHGMAWHGMARQDRGAVEGRETPPTRTRRGGLATTSSVVYTSVEQACSFLYVPYPNTHDVRSMCV